MSVLSVQLVFLKVLISCTDAYKKNMEIWKHIRGFTIPQIK